MKPFLFILIVTLMVGSPLFLAAQVVDQKVHRVVFQVTKGETADQQQVIGQLNNILRALPQAEIEVICHGKALPLVLRTQSNVKDEVTDLITRGWFLLLARIR